MPNLQETSPIKSAISSVWQAEIQEEYMKRSILEAITFPISMDASGKYIINKIVADTDCIVDYEGNDLEFKKGATTPIELIPDQHKAFAMEFPTIDYAMTHTNVREALIRQRTNELQLSTCNHVLGLIRASEEIQKLEVTLSKTNIYDSINTAVRKLDSKEVPSDSRVILMNWATLTMLEQSSQFANNFHVATELNGLSNVTVSGVQVLLTNLIQDGEIIVLHKDAIAQVQYLDQVKFGEMEKRFSEYVKVLSVHGALIARPESIVRIAPSMAKTK